MSDQLPPAHTLDPLQDIYDHEPPAWPKVVGIVSIVVSGLGLTCGGCGLGMMAFMPSLMKSAEQQFGPMPPGMQGTPVQLAHGGVGLAWALVLLAAGIMLVTRKPAARPLHLLYAAGSIVLGAIGVVLMLKQQAALAEWFRQNPDSKWAQYQSPIGNLIGLAVAVVLSFAYPLFVLIWFGMVKRRSADITEGVAEQVA